VASRSEDLKLIIRVINFELVQPVCPRYVNVTDRQTKRRTDGRTTYDSNTALALRASRGKNHILFCFPWISWILKTSPILRETGVNVLYVVWRPLCMEPLEISAQALYCQNLQSNLYYIFVSDYIWFYFHSNFRGGLRKTHVFWNTVRNGPSRSSKVGDFGTNRKSVCDFLLVINNNLGSILLRFKDVAGFLRRATPPLFYQNFRGSLWTRLPMLWLRGAKTLS